MYSFSIFKKPPPHSFCRVDKKVCQRWLICKKSTTQKNIRKGHIERNNQLHLPLLKLFFEGEICKCKYYVNVIYVS